MEGELDRVSETWVSKKDKEIVSQTSTDVSASL